MLILVYYAKVSPWFHNCIPYKKLGPKIIQLKLAISKNYDLANE